MLYLDLYLLTGLSYAEFMHRSMTAYRLEAGEPKADAIIYATIIGTWPAWIFVSAMGFIGHFIRGR